MTARLTHPSHPFLFTPARSSKRNTPKTKLGEYGKRARGKKKADPKIETKATNVKDKSP
jgi:hypothetical protein